MSSTEEAIREYWESPDAVSLIDTNLRQLEERVVLDVLEPGMELLDIGCGDGVSTVHYAERVQWCVGLERSAHLREKAASRLANAGIGRVEIHDGDVLELGDYAAQFDVVVTQRVLINLVSWEQQQRAIQQIRNTLRPGGLYVMIENTYEGHDRLNDVRQRVGLPKISKHWHNLYLHERDMECIMYRGFRLVRHVPFSLYYLLTRVYMNQMASFEGCGREAKQDALFGPADAAARRMQEQIGEMMAGPPLGAIQAWVLRREDG